MRYALIAAVVLAGCAGPSVVVMREPATGRIVQCGAGVSPMEEIVVGQAAKDCATGYQAAGWVRMN